MARSSSVFSATHTGLSAKQADAYRIYKEERGERMPRDPMERVREYYEKVLKKPVPSEIIAATERPEGVPDSSTWARRVARKYGLDLRSILGTGPNGKIVQRDIEAKLAEIRRRVAGEDGEAPPGEE